MPCRPRAGRIRRPGAGGQALRERDPELEATLDALIDPAVGGDPASPLRWTGKSTGQLALARPAAATPVIASTVGLMLKKQGYRLQANVKTKESASRSRRPVPPPERAGPGSATPACCSQ